MASRYPGSMRARDEDRANTGSTLDEAFAQGQLSAEEHTSRVRSAMSAATLADLHRLIDDLQGETDLAPMRASLPQTKGPSNLIPVLTGLVVLVVAGVLMLRACSGSGSDSDAAPASQFGSAGYLTLAGLTDIVVAMQNEFGDALVDDLSVFPDYAVIDRPDPAAPRRQLSYRFDEDGFHATSPTTRDADLVPVDLATVDLTKVAGVVAGAPQSLNLDPVDSLYLSIGSEVGDDPDVSVHASNDLGENGHLTAYLDGTFRAVYPFDPDN
ncbi:MAG TPA: DUF1707 domain-containing protein [Aldersonia sp.]